MKPDEIKRFISEQCEVWPECRANFMGLDTLMTKEIARPDGATVCQIRFNPARMASSSAPAATTSAPPVRKCFLCRANRPDCQMTIPSGDYEILVNPFPVFPIHLTIPSTDHKPQLIAGNIGNMLDFAAQLEGLTVFYNGPRCGASAPDHHHFQAARFEIPRNLSEDNGDVRPYNSPLASGIEIMSAEKEMIVRNVDRILSLLPQDRPEPMVNLLCRREADGKYRMVVIPRKKHRPSCYGEYIISPAAVEMAGYVITPRKEDFERIDHDTVSRIFSEVTFNQQEINNLCNSLK